MIDAAGILYAARRVHERAIILADMRRVGDDPSTTIVALLSEFRDLGTALGVLVADLPMRPIRDHLIETYAAEMHRLAVLNKGASFHGASASRAKPADIEDAFAALAGALGCCVETDPEPQIQEAPDGPAYHPAV